jgi:transposase
MESSTWYVIKQRLAWIKMHERGAPVTRVCQHYGISRKTFYKWWHRYQEAGRDFHVLKDLSRRPHSHPRAVPRATVERVMALRRRTRYGPRRLAYYLAQAGVSISAFGVYRVLQRVGLVKRHRSRPRKKPQSYAMAIPGQRVQVDVKYLPPLKLRGRPEPLQQYLYNAIDDCTRLQVAWVSSALTPQASVRFLEDMLRTYPFPIQEVQTDHGVEFTYVFFPHVQKPHPFEQVLQSHGIHHKLIPVGMPQQNGKSLSLSKAKDGTLPPYPGRGVSQLSHLP